MERKDKRKSNKSLILIVSGVVVVGAVTGGYFAYSTWQKSQELNKAEKSAKTFLKHLSKQSFDQFPDLLSESSLKQSGYDKETVVEKYQTVFSGIQAQGIKSKDIKVTQEKMSSLALLIKLK
ncbi:hypothetical protein A5881_000315 [Enterococcus termitis]